MVNHHIGPARRNAESGGVTKTSRALLAAAGLLVAGIAPAASAAPSGGSWFTAWSRPQSVAVAGVADTLKGGRGPGPLLDQSVRDIVRVSGAGTAVRIRVSNRYGPSLSPNGTLPIHIASASIAQRMTRANVNARTIRTVTFGGSNDVTVRAGATVISDPIALPVAALEDLAVSLHVDFAPLAPQHGASFVTSYITPTGSGDHTHDADGAAFTQQTSATLLLTAVDVRSTKLRGLVATTGGSVVDGFGTEIDSYSDFPAWLAKREQRELPAGQQKTVVNNGLGGTTAAKACDLPGTGPSVQERLANDSLALSGLTHLIVYAGTNDLGDQCNAKQIISGYRSILKQAKARGVKVLISTITPRGQYTAVQNANRALVNAWVRKGGNCSGECYRSLDFDRAIRDPQQPNRIDPKLDSGDGIHPTGEGYRRIAASIPLSALR